MLIFFAKYLVKLYQSNCEKVHIRRTVKIKSFRYVGVGKKVTLATFHEKYDHLQPTWKNSK
jgi:hypothetical protein